MKVKKYSFIVVLLIMLFSAAFILPAAATQAEEQAPGTEFDYEVVYDGEENFLGVNIKESLRGALQINTVNTIAGNPFCVTTFEFGQSIDTAKNSGFLIKLSGHTANANNLIRIIFEDDQGAYYRAMNNTETRSDVFILEDGSVSSLDMKSYYHTLVPMKNGTLYLPWEVIDKMAQVEGADVSMEKGTKLTKMHLGLSANATYVKRSVTIGTIAVVSVGEEVAVTKLLDTRSLTYSADATAADVNVNTTADGTKVYSKYGLNTGAYGNPLPADNAVSINTSTNWNYSRLPAEIILNYVDAAGEVIAASNKINVSFDKTTASFPYNLQETVDNKEIEGYSFVSADKNLQGTASGQLTINLTYKPSGYILTQKFVDGDGREIKLAKLTEYLFSQEDIPYSVTAPRIAGYTFVSADKSLEGNISEDMEIVLTYSLDKELDYDVITDGEGAFVGVNILDSLNGAISLRTKGILQNNPFGVVTFDFDRIVDPSLSDGLLIKFMADGAGTNFIRIILESDDGSYYRTMALANAPMREDVFVLEDGSVTSLAAQYGAHTVVPGVTGTVFLPWSLVVHKDGADVAMEDGTKFTKLHLAMPMYGRYAALGITVGSFATVKVEGEEVFVDKLMNTAQMLYTTSAENLSSDVNLASLDKGGRIYVRRSMTGENEFMGAADEQTAITRSNWNIARKAPFMSVRYVDIEGREISSTATVITVYGDGTSASYDITPPAIFGYTYKEATLPLTGTVDENSAITLTYSYTEYTITLVFVDHDGEEISSKRTVKSEFKGIYEIEPDEIKGYTYTNASNKLTGTTMSDMTITLAYTKNSNCGSSVNYDSMYTLAAVIAGAGLLIAVRRKDIKK